MKKTIRQRFEERYQYSPGCWIWTAGKTDDGYGYICSGKKTIRAHRYSYSEYVGEIGKGLFVCHKCDVPLCVNPDHLFLGTNADNMEDKISKKRHARKESAGNVKLSLEKVEEIRSFYKKNVKGRGTTFIAKKYGIAPSVIWMIVNNLRWVPE